MSISVDSVVDTEKFASWIQLQTNISKQCLNKQLNEWSNDSKQLNNLSIKFKRFKVAFEKEPKLFNQCSQIFKEVAEIEQQINKLIKTHSNLEKESYNEILFLRPVLQPLNFIPLILTIWSFIRVYLLPGLSFIVPFLTLLAPYIILKFAFNLPITFNNYMNILHSMLSGNFGKILDPTSSDTSGFNISPAAFLKQFGIVMVTFIQGIIQPYWTFKHLKSIDTIIQDNGKAIIRFSNLYLELEKLLQQHGFTFYKCPIPEIYNKRDATARVILESNYFKLALKYIGSLEVIMCLANKSEIHPVHWINSERPIFKATNTFDFQVPTINRKPISARFVKKRNALLTGPNKGGKSTALRALSFSALLGHTYGCAPGQLTMTPFEHMFVCLKPDDLPGSKSRFEREIEFTANTLKFKNPILVFIDELYHSTNPPDALRSCQIYCEQLWAKPNVISIISTHLFELVEKADNQIQRLCCPATLDKNNNIHYTYKLINGICKISSVDELLKQNGLMCG